MEKFLASRLLKNMDREVEPCDDFYDFACGGFLKSTIIPDDKTTVNTFTGISDELQNQLRTSIEEKSPPNEPKPFRLVKNLYKACMNKSEYAIYVYIFLLMKRIKSISFYINVISRYNFKKNNFSGDRAARLRPFVEYFTKTWWLAYIGKPME